MLKVYDEGKPEMKPDVIQQTKDLREQRVNAQQRLANNSYSGVKVKLDNGDIKELTTDEVINMLNAHKREIIRLNAIIEKLNNNNTIINE
mgnify:CR=1 FL=1